MYHINTTGCVVEHGRWGPRKAKAAELVRKGLLTLRERSERFGLPTDEIANTRH
jgi:hypothetical protein